MDVLNKLLKFIDHERGKVFGVLAAIVIVLGAYGCEVKLASPISGRKVTQKQFEVELESAKAKLEGKISQVDIEMRELLANSEITQADFDKWEELKNKGFDIAGGVVTSVVSGGGVNTSQLIASLLAAVGIGGTVGGLYDSNRKNKVIEENKNKKEVG